MPHLAFDRVMQTIHDDPTAGHLGVKKTQNRFNLKYYMENAAKRVKQYVKSCHQCQVRKPAWTRRVGDLKPLALVGRPFERIGMDTIGPLRKTAAGNTKVLLITDHHTKYAIAQAVTGERAEVLARILFKEVW